MMCKIPKSIMLFIIGCLIPIPSFADITLKVIGRDANFAGLQTPFHLGDTTLNVNALDCSEAQSIEIYFRITVDGNTIDAEGPMKFYRGPDCDTNSDECEIIGEEVPVAPVADLQLTISSLLPSEGCDASGETEIWVGVGEDTVLNNLELWSDAVAFNWDTEEPPPPVLLSTQAGDEKVVVNWSFDDDESDGGTESSGSTNDIEAYLVLYWSGSEGGSDSDADTDTIVIDAGAEDGGVKSSGDCPSGGFEAGDAYEPNLYGVETVSSPDLTSATITGLTNGIPYKFALVSRDAHYNYSVISEVVCEMAGETSGFWDACVGAGCQGGKFCFVATAAFGSYDHPVVKTLRRFRDGFIEKVPGGVFLIKTYYEVGPQLATYVDNRPTLNGMVRCGLTILAVTTVPLTALGPRGVAWISFLGFLVLIFTTASIRKKKRRIRCIVAPN